MKFAVCLDHIPNEKQLKETSGSRSPLHSWVLLVVKFIIVINFFSDAFVLCYYKYIFGARKYH